MARPALSMAALAFVAIALSMLIPVLGQFAVGPLAALLIGAGAGWWASKAMGGGTAGRGAGAGALAGLGALIGAALGLAILLGINGNRVTNNAEFRQTFEEQLEQQLEQQREANPDATIPEIDPSDFGAAAGAIGGITGAVAGFCLGLGYLFLSTIGGLIAGVMYGRNRGPVPAMASGGYAAGGYQPPYEPPPPGQAPAHLPRMSGTSSDLPQMTNRSSTEQEHGARIYPDDTDENRPRS